MPPFTHSPPHPAPGVVTVSTAEGGRVLFWEPSPREALAPLLCRVVARAAADGLARVTLLLPENVAPEPRRHTEAAAQALGFGRSAMRVLRRRVEPGEDAGAAETGADEAANHAEGCEPARVPCNITLAHLADLPQLCGLLGELFAQEADFQPDQARQAAALRLILGDPAVGRIFVAREPESGSETGRVLGLVNLLLLPGGDGRAHPGVLLEDLIVRREARGRGVASALLRRALAWAREAGAGRITLLTDATNDRALRLYQRHGFEFTEAVVWRRSIALPESLEHFTKSCSRQFLPSR